MATLPVGGVDLEYRFEPAVPGHEHDPPLVFLHEGLGSVELWRDFPDQVRSRAGGSALLVYSREGYGRSTPRQDPRPLGYMHDEALIVLPEVLEQLGIRRPILVGHSDGASIAIIHAGAGHAVSGLVLLAPHVFVEDRTVAGIAQARDTYLTTDMAERMARYHDDADATFWGWNDVWLSDEFRHWNIEEYLPGVTGPVLIVQGDADEYGSLAQVDSICRGAAGPVTTAIIEGGGHSPHISHRDRTVDAIARWLP